jgi:hypothetical protein
MRRPDSVRAADRTAFSAISLGTPFVHHHAHLDQSEHVDQPSGGRQRPAKEQRELSSCGTWHKLAQTATTSVVGPCAGWPVVPLLERGQWLLRRLLEGLDPTRVETGLAAVARLCAARVVIGHPVVAKWTASRLYWWVRASSCSTHRLEPATHLRRTRARHA